MPQNRINQKGRETVRKLLRFDVILLLKITNINTTFCEKAKKISYKNLKKACIYAGIMV